LKIAKLKSPDQAEREYVRLLQWYVRDIVAATRRIVINKLSTFKYTAKNELKTDGYTEDIILVLAQLLDAVVNSGRVVEARLPSIFALMARNNDRALILAVKQATGMTLAPATPGASRSLLGVDLYRGEPWLKDMQSAWVKQNVSLVKSIGTQYHDQLTTVIQNGVFNGLSVKQLAGQIEDKFGVTKNRATLIAQDQILGANARITQIRAESIGVNQYEWETVMDSRVRPEHAELQGKIFSWNKPPSIGHPGTPIRCLPYHSNIEVAHGCSKLWRRTNTVKAATLITESGKSIEATFNHPVLTNRGWQAIQNVHVGDYLFSTSNESFHGFKNDIQATPIQIGQIFDLVSGYIGFDTSHTFSSLEFNGDAIDSVVQTIDISSFLPNILDSEFIKPFGKLLFTVADNILSNTEFSIDSPLALSAFRLWYSSDSVVRGFCKLLSILNRESGHSDEIRFAAISDICSAIDKMSAYDNSTALILFGQSQFALTAGIFCNQFVNRKLFSIVCNLSNFGNDVANSDKSLSQISRMAIENFCGLGNTRNFTGCIENANRISKKIIGVNAHSHVYNLETYHSWYTSDSLIIHNCRCRAGLILPEF
jgi:SPP1 gp7 family putative phage head morphogenesis protein